jgi:dTDP-4-amino-4,6-dideoxygalactose transaminase
MELIKKIARKNGIVIIEDAAHAVNSFYQGKAAGSFGKFGCYSFHGSKNFSSGEGGALIINSNEKKLLEKAEIIREKGTNRSSFLRGEIAKYNWVGEGSSYLPSDILMAFLLAQLEKMEEITKKRKEIFDFYNYHLQEFLAEDFLNAIPQVPGDRKSNYHLYYLKFKNQKIRDFILKKLRKRGIEASFHFQPLHASPMGKRLGYQKGDLSLTNQIAYSMLRLPIYPGLSGADLNYIINELKNIFLEMKQAGV